MNSLTHVVVDATAIPVDRGGVGRYLEHLIPALAKIGRLRVSVIAQGRDVSWISATAPGTEVIAAPAATSRRLVRLLWEQFALPGVARRVGADVIFSPHYTIPLLARQPVVVTFHDATFFSLPDVHLRSKRVFFRAWMRVSARRARRIIVPSNATLGEIEKWLPASQNRMTTAHHGVDRELFHEPTPAQRRDAQNRVGSSSWIAFLGTIEPRKNIGNLIRAFAIVKRTPSVNSLYPELTLAIAGGQGWDDTVDRVIEHTNMSASIRRLGFVPDDELAGILGGALLVAYPSIGEGFGLPLAEAMACGAATLTTPRLALPEIGGDAAVYREPDPESLADGLLALLTDPEERARRAAASVTRSREFSWISSATVHRDVLVAATEKAPT